MHGQEEVQEQAAKMARNQEGGSLCLLVEAIVIAMLRHDAHPQHLGLHHCDSTVRVRPCIVETARLSLVNSYEDTLGTLPSPVAVAATQEVAEQATTT